MGLRKGYKHTKETIAKIRATRAANLAKLGRTPKKRKVESDATEQHAGDADYSTSTTGRVYPRFSSWDRGWE